MSLHQKQKIAFLGYINGLHYVSTLPNTNAGCQADNKRKEMLEKKRVYAKKQRAKESPNAKRLRLEKMAEHKKSKRSASTIDQSNYLNEFDAIKHGPLHDQCWANVNMKQFHKSMQYLILQCIVCKEAWPSISKPKSPNSYVCSRCSRDKGTPKKFSCDNAMIPDPVPIELQDLTQTEEMLIAQAPPVMRVYTKPGGQRGYSGHCVNLPQHVEELATVLPRYPRDLSIIVIKMKGKDNTFKDIKVRRQKVHNALSWLVNNNLHYKHINISQHALETLPVDGVPSDLMTVESDGDDLSDEITLPDLGPSNDNNDDRVYNQETEMSSFMLVCEKQKQEVECN